MSKKETTVVNIVSVPRPYYDVYIGRRHDGIGMFGNPFELKYFNNNRTRVLSLYKYYFWARLDMDPNFKKWVEGLRGQILGCFCKPKECHGDIIVDHLEGRLQIYYPQAEHFTLTA
jgi:hypothetical protein